MKHYLFDALKISPVPLETANKVTEVGWMLEIEKILNNILAECSESSEKLNKDTYEKIEELKNEIHDLVKNEFISSSHLEEIHKLIIDSFSEILGDCVNLITFGIDEDGYFYADIPEVFSGLQFGTTTEPDDFGRLYIEY